MYVSKVLKEKERENGQKPYLKSERLRSFEKLMKDPSNNPENLTQYK